MFQLVGFGLEFLICVPFGVYFWIRNRGSRLTGWLALIAIMLGINGLQIVLEAVLPPPVGAGGQPKLDAAPWWLQPAWIVTSVLNVLINSFFYYAILVVALLYNGWAPRSLVALLAAPIALTYLVGIDVHVNDLNYRLIAAWGAVYWLAAAALFGVAIWQEQRAGPRDVGIGIGVPAMAAILLLPSLMLLVHQLHRGPWSLLSYVFLACIVSLSVFFFMYIRGTVAAIRRELLARAARLEAAFTEHALKNSIAKVKMHALNIRRGLKAGEYEQAGEHVSRLLAIADHMLSAAKRISQSGGAGLAVQPGWHNLQNLVDEALAPLAVKPSVRIVRHDRPCLLLLDARLVAECLTNVINNSLEAMDGRGTLTISLRETRRHAVLSIRDDGPGLSAWAVAHVFQPFYSSKHGGVPAWPDRHYGNYGLGMAFVQAVMRGHRGRAEMQSDPGEGAVVRLVFPKGEWQEGAA